jgi:tetratricopeptide (TPR) repeat protein
MCLRALAIYEGHVGSESQLLVPVLVMLAAAHGSMGDSSRRRELLERAVKARENSELGAVHPELPKLLSQLAQAVGEAGDASRKKDLLVRVLAMREKALGPQHHELASTIVNLGNTYGLLGDVVKKRELLERALDIQQRHYGDEHTEVAAVLVNLGNAHGALGDAAKKKELLVKALRIQEEAASRSRIGGKDCSDVTRTMVSTIVNLGNVCGDLGSTATKKELLERALALQEALLKEKSSPTTYLELATILHNLGAAYGETGDFWKQRDALERALRIKETQVRAAHQSRCCHAGQCFLLRLQFGADHFELAKTLANLGLACVLAAAAVCVG